MKVQDGDSTPPGFPVVVLPAVGISIDSAQGNALRATSEFTALDISSTSTATGKDAVAVAYNGTGSALFAESLKSTNAAGAVTGVNHGAGSGVRGEQRNNSAAGFGVLGIAGTRGRGAQFKGGAAAVRMVPSAAATHPATGRVGDFFVDAKARLWFCNKTSSGNIPARWKRIA